MIRVFLLDDHEVVRRSVTDLLHAAGDIEVVGESGSAQEATRRLPALRPDIAVLDARGYLTATASTCAGTCGQSTPPSNA